MDFGLVCVGLNYKFVHLGLLMLQVGACLVSQDGIILGKFIRFLYPFAFLCETWIFTLIVLLSGIGYNGFPRGCSDDKLPWAKVGILRELFSVFILVLFNHSHSEISVFQKSRTGNPLETKYP